MSRCLGDRSSNSGITAEQSRSDLRGLPSRTRTDAQIGFDWSASEVQGGEPLAEGDQAPAGEQASGEHVCRVCGGSAHTDGGECEDCGGTGKTIEATSAGA